MEIILLLVIIWMIGTPRWLGEHLAEAHAWQKYYQPEANRKTRRAIAKVRLKRIRKKHYNSFRAEADRRYY